MRKRNMELAARLLPRRQNLGTQGVADYIYNLGVACRLDSVIWRTSGIVASVIAAYLREKERVAELGFESEESECPRQHKKGERQGFPAVTVTMLKYSRSQFGVKTLCKFEDAAGNVLIWWASGNTEWLTEGDVLDITGTVEKHGDYNGKLQTELRQVARACRRRRHPKCPRDCLHSYGITHLEASHAVQRETGLEAKTPWHERPSRD